MATIYIYESAKFDNYHSGGGVVVVANSQEEHDALVKDAGGLSLLETGPLGVSYETKASPAVPGAIYLFPDAGCC